MTVTRVRRHACTAAALLACVALTMPERPAQAAAPPAPVYLDFGGSFAVAYAATARSDGGLVLVGSTLARRTPESRPESALAVAAIGPDGAPDQSFGDGGSVATLVGDAADDVGQAVRVLADGRVEVAGYTNGGRRIFLARYAADGTPDATLGQAGVLTAGAPIPIRKFPEVHNVSFQADGKVVAAGNECNTRHCTFEAMRFTTNLQPDPSFGRGGVAIAPVTARDRQAYGFVQQRDGRLVGYGYATRPGKKKVYDATLVRLNADGTLDRSFGAGGVRTTVVGGGVSDAFGVAETPDGFLTAITYVEWPRDVVGGHGWGVLRMTRRGRIVRSFAADGRLAVGVGTEGLGFPYGIGLARDGTTIVAGHASLDGPASSFAALRIHAGSRADVAVEPLPGPGAGRAHAVVPDKGRGVWLVGTAARPGSKVEQMVALHLPARTLAEFDLRRIASGRALRGFELHVDAPSGGAVRARATRLAGLRCPCRAIAVIQRTAGAPAPLAQRRIRLTDLADPLFVTVRAPRGRSLSGTSVLLSIEDRYGHRGARRQALPTARGG
jgi:uncharacterized delta-60 repeat protein